jgi:hypothetical protein
MSDKTTRQKKSAATFATHSMDDWAYWDCLSLAVSDIRNDIRKDVANFRAEEHEHDDDYHGNEHKNQRVFD